MKLIAISKIRNHALLKERERRGFNQKEMSEFLGVPMHTYCRPEKLEFPNKFDEEMILNIACKLSIQPDDIMPEGLAGVSILNKTESVAEVSTENILDCGFKRDNYILESPIDIAEKYDDANKILSYIDELSERERKVIKMRFGVGGDATRYTYKEIAKIYSVSAERIRGIEMEAIRKIRMRYVCEMDRDKFAEIPEKEHKLLCRIAMNKTN